MKQSKQKNFDAEAESNEDVEFEMKEAVQIPDGVHTGFIKSIVYAERGEFQYVDVRVSMDGIQDINVKTGFPAKITPNSSFGKFLISAGFEVKPGKTVKLSDLREALLDRSVQYTTFTEDVYARIVNKSIKFLK